MVQSGVIRNVSVCFSVTASTQKRFEASEKRDIVQRSDARKRQSNNWRRSCFEAEGKIEERAVHVSVFCTGRVWLR